MPAPAPTEILLVEHECDIAALITHTLERSGDICVSTVMSGVAALDWLSHRHPDLLILDINVPVISGSEVCRLLRSCPATASLPIIMLAARTDEADCVSRLGLGADGYVANTFGLRDIGARVRAVLGRKQTGAESPAQVYRGGKVCADFDAVVVTVEGEPIRLTDREFELLRLFVQNRDRVLSRNQLVKRVWGRHSDVETRLVDRDVARLRLKLRAAGSQIETVPSLGYRFVDEF